MLRLDGFGEAKANPQCPGMESGRCPGLADNSLKDAVPSWVEGLPGLEIRGADGGGLGHCQGLKQGAAGGQGLMGCGGSVKPGGGQEEACCAKGAM